MVTQETRSRKKQFHWSLNDSGNTRNTKQKKTTTLIPFNGNINLGISQGPRLSFQQTPLSHKPATEASAVTTLAPFTTRCTAKDTTVNNSNRITCSNCHPAWCEVNKLHLGLPLKENEQITPLPHHHHPTPSTHTHSYATIPQSIYLERHPFVSFWRVVSPSPLSAGFHSLRHLVAVCCFQRCRCHHNHHPPPPPGWPRPAKPSGSAQRPQTRNACDLDWRGWRALMVWREPGLAGWGLPWQRTGLPGVMSRNCQNPGKKIPDFTTTDRSCAPCTGFIKQINKQS